MKNTIVWLVGGLLLSLSPNAAAATRYVNASNSTPAAPYTNWVTAATTIQDAVDLAVAGDQILVTNGVYQSGARAVYGMSNRVAVTKPLVVQSVNGPGVTTIMGLQDPSTTNGPAAVRCVYLTNGAVLAGFTLASGATQSTGDYDEQMSGGGVWCESHSVVVSNCTLCSNSASYSGGGAYSGTLNNCTLTGNSAGDFGGGSYFGTLNSCTLTGNSASSGGGSGVGTLNNCTLSDNSGSFSGGGAFGGTLNNCAVLRNSGGGAAGVGDGPGFGGGPCVLNNCTVVGNSWGVYAAEVNNCILYYNGAKNYESSTLEYCCTTPLPAGGTENTDNDPQLASAYCLSAHSPCIGKGSYALVSGVDIDGEPWANPPSIGCDEYWTGSVTGAVSAGLALSYTNVSVGFVVSFQSVISGRVSASSWDFGDGVVVSNRPYASHAWLAGGDYVVVLRAYNESYPAGVAASITVHVVTQPVHYVAVDGSSPVSPYSSWATAATDIQNAVDAATVSGALVLVSNGVYQAGGRAVYGMSNRVAVTKPLTVQSLNGAAVTSIVGSGPNGSNAVRCVYLTNGAVLAGFTLTNGATQTSGDELKQQSGGGIWCESASAAVSNCVLSGNSAYNCGGGAWSGTLNNCVLSGNSASSCGGACLGTLNNCLLSGNSASSGGGAGGWWDASGGIELIKLNNCTVTGNTASYDGGGVWVGTLNNCTLTDNSASYGGGASGLETGSISVNSTLSNCTLSGNQAYVGGGVYSGTLNNCTLTGNSAVASGGGACAGELRNCIVYYNAAPDGNYDLGSSLNCCCTTPSPANGTNNLTVEPELASTSHLSANSPCIGRGSAAYTGGLDIDGEPWANPPSIGCDEYWRGSVTGAISAAISASFTNVAVGFGVDFQAVIGGRVSASSWDFGDGVVVSNRPWASHVWLAAGAYVVELRAYNESYPAGIAVSVTVQVADRPVHYVALGSVNPLPPYRSWATAATNIQDAVDAAWGGAVVLVTNGLYQTGGRDGSRVVVNKIVIVLSVNGPAVTSIVGSGPNGSNAVRCVSLTGGAVLAGFTLTNGAMQGSGGGLWCESSSEVVSNCILTGNWASYAGGGAYYGTLNNCTLTGNSASAYGYGGGACFGTLNNCAVTGNSAESGGGEYNATLNNCTLTGNSAEYGGGANLGTLNNCTLMGNSASGRGGGASWGTLNNCVLTDNWAVHGGGGSSDGTLINCTLSGNSAYWDGGGAMYGSLINCIVYYNTALTGGNYYDSALTYCCTTPLPNGIGNFTAPPLFLYTNGWGNLRLQSNSPCINAGFNTYTPGAADLDGNLRIIGGTVDVGAYEFQFPRSVISYAWMQQYGLPIDGSADFTDPDHDGLNNWQEWRCQTEPTNALSALRLLSVAPISTNVTVTWQSVPGVSYFLERCTNLGSLPPFSLLATDLPGQFGTTSFTDTNTAGASLFFYRVGVGN